MTITPITAAIATRTVRIDPHAIREVVQFKDDRIRDELFSRLPTDGSRPDYNLVAMLSQMHDEQLIPILLKQLSNGDGQRRRSFLKWSRSGKAGTLTD